MLDISSKYTDIEVVGTFKDKFNVLWARVDLARRSYSVR